MPNAQEKYGEFMSDAPPPPPPPVPPPPASPPPGWYHDGVAMRWWDGVAWGPFAPGGGASSDDRTLSILTHGGVLVGGFILPLVFYLIADDKTRPETRWNAREALNFQLTFLVAYLGSFIVFFAGLALSGAFGASGSDAGAGIGFGISFIVFFVVIFGAVIVNFVFSIIGAMRANAGIRWRYPLRIPFVRG